jgi:hypothetical protein
MQISSLHISTIPRLPLYIIPLLSLLTTNAQAQTQLPSTVYIWPMGNASQNAMMSSLAGVVNHQTSGALLLSPDNGSLPNPRFWLDQLKLSYPTVQSQVQSNSFLLINQFKSKLSGYILYDQSVNNQSLNIATSIAGVTNAIIVDPSTQINAQIAGLPMLADARNMTYTQAYNNYATLYNKDMIFHQSVGFDHHLRDFAIQNKGFVYYTSPTTLNPTAQPAYASNQNHQGRVFGWADSEVDLFNQASQNNQQVVASNYSWSTSTTSNWKVPIQQQKYHTPGNVTTKTGKHYVAFVMSDGDNAQWLTNGFPTDPKWFGSPYRGNFNMTWDFTPSLKDMNPTAHNYLYSKASNGAYKDNFVDAGGAGTAFPSQYPDINGLAADIAQSMASADLKVTSILDPTYTKSKLTPILDQDQVMGIMFKTYDNYYRRNAAIDWYNGKPIMSVKYSLWDGADTAQSLAAALNASTHTNAIDDQLSYDIINVHPWSVNGPTGAGSTGDPMSNLNQLTQWLDPSKVEVVTLEEMMVQLRNHFGTPLPGAQINATWTRNASDVWTTRTNWTGASPNFIDANVTFGSAITAPRVITLNLPVKAGALNFNSAFAYTLSGIPTNTLTLDTTTGSAAINVTTGNHSISAPLALADDTVITVTPSTSTLTITNLQTTPRALTKSGAGTLQVNRVRASALNITAGTLRIATNGGDPGLTIVNTLTLSPTAALDLTNNDLVVNNGDFATIQSLVFAGYSSSPDPTKTGITSTSSQSVNGTTILALFNNALAGFTQWPPGSGNFIATEAIAGKYTYLGDTNQDGQVTPQDYTAVDSNLGATNIDPGIAWFYGDTNFDTNITPQDYTAIDSALGFGQGNPLAARGLAPIPEPTTLPLLAVAFLLLPRRHRLN